MRVVFDIEANALYDPDKIWVIVCKDIDDFAEVEVNGNFVRQFKTYIFRNLHEEDNRKLFKQFARGVSTWIGHNICGYDIPVLRAVADYAIPCDICIDTLVVSKLANYSLNDEHGKHSIEAYGSRFGLEKLEHGDFSHYSSDMEIYCIRDVDICHRIYLGLSDYISDPAHLSAIQTEQLFELKCIATLQKNGFAFNTEAAQKLLEKVTKELETLDADILDAFPPRRVVVRTFTPRATKFGTISKSSVPRALHENLKDYEVGKEYELTKLVEFNPSSHKQIIEVLHEAGWHPVDKTKTHKDNLRNPDADKQLKMDKYGWRVNESNLATLPPSAPKGAKLLAKRILLESRRRSLVEWLGLVESDGRIHGKFYGIGAWTHRMAHQEPNTANIPNDKDDQGRTKLLGKEMRSLWRVPKKRLLVGVDAEGIQLRIFAHYINDPEFTEALVNGKKEDKTDAHSLNQRVLGCSDRQQAKRFIFALLLGAGLGKLAEILDCERDEAERALERLLVRYQGFALLKRDVIPQDAQRGWFVGLDGRSVPIPSDTLGGRKHLAMSGYLQNGEAVVMKLATLKFIDKLAELDSLFVNLVHDEWQIEGPNDFQVAMQIANLCCRSLEEVGRDLKLSCPLSGSFHNGKDYTFGSNWYQTH